MRLPSECYQMQKTIETHLPHLSQPQLTGLALWVCGAILAGSACQNAVASALSPWSNWYNLRQRLREWLYDGGDRATPCQTELDVTLCFAPLLRWVLCWWRSGGLALAIDPTLKGDQTTAIVISVLYRSCAIPVAWHIRHADQPGSWMDPTVELLQALAPAVPENMTVIVLCDRGIASPKLTWDTRVGTMELHIPKLREGSYFPSLLEPRRRSEKALLSVIQQAYVEGVSTRRVDDLIKALGCDGISSSQVSRICEQLDEVVESFLGRPLDGGPYPYVWLDGLTQKVREGGRIVNVCVVVATGVNAEGQREILGMDVGASEDGAFWLAFLRSLTARGLSGVELATSDAHQGLKNAIAAVFAGASWQRCRTHFMANLLTRVPKRAQPGVATMVRTIYQQLSPAEVHGQLDRVVEQLREPFAQVAELLADAAPDILAFTAFPVAHWQKLWSNNPQERLNREIRRRTDVVGIFPNRQSARRLVGAVLAEQHDEWAEARRYLTIPNAVGNEALPEPDMLEAAA